MNITLAAGGTGGHMTPAQALADELKRRGHGVMLVTDQRGASYPGLFEDVPVEVLPAGRLGGGPLGMLKAVFSVMKGRKAARALYRDFTPDVVVGFGGYPAFPALLAASAEGVPTVLHEQNAVLGRVNRLLAGKAKAVATAYKSVARLKDQSKAVHVGNPVRAEIKRLGEMPFPSFDATAPLHVLVTGGSQGATILGRVVPEALAMLEPSLRHRLNVTQQCRPEDIERARARYAELDIPATLMTYIEDMPHELETAHLFIGRAGASTIAELTAAGRPAILVPLAIATDDHQTANARELHEAGGGRAIPEGQFTPETLARQVEAIALDPQALATAADRALGLGKPRAAEDLADLVLRVGAGEHPLPTDPVGRPVRAPVANGMGAVA